jgi:hypothetical protein
MLSRESEDILDDNMDKADKENVSTSVGDLKIMDKADVADVSAIVGVKDVTSKLKFKTNFSGCKGHMLACKTPSPLALKDILDWMILSGEDITYIRCFLVGLVTENNRQYDHGDNSHKKMTGDNWQNDHGDNSQGWETRSSCNICSGRLGPKTNLLIYEVVQGGRCEECLLLQENIIRNRHNRNWQSSRHNDVEAVNQLFGANKVEINQKMLKALRLLRQADHAVNEVCEYFDNLTKDV